jgi:DNA-binding NarL/FixJ family response regulator
MASITAHGAACVGVPRLAFGARRDFVDYSDAGLAKICPECRRSKPRAPRYSPALLGQPLTWREVQVVDLIAAGKLNKEIAYELHLSDGTIKAYTSFILAKTGQPNRTALAVWWALGHYR